MATKKITEAQVNSARNKLSKMITTHENAMEKWHKAERKVYELEDNLRKAQKAMEERRLEGLKMHRMIYEYGKELERKGIYDYIRTEKFDQKMSIAKMMFGRK